MEQEATLEAILFAAGESVEATQLAIALDIDVKRVHALMSNLMEAYASRNSGITIIRLEDSYQMCTNQKYFDYIQKLYEAPQKKLLSQTLLETLAIIAYRQPITKIQIEEIRGVTADHAVNRLVSYGLVCEKGRLDAPGRPLLFGTTDEFLRYFGFVNTDKMPPLDESEEFMSTDHNEMDKL